MIKQLEVTIEIIFHATEDTKKVFDQIFDLFDIKENEFMSEKIQGYHGNPITLAKVKLVKNRANDFVNSLLSKTPNTQINDICEKIDMYIEDSSMFLRISKNDLMRKAINLQQDNAVKIRIKIPIYRKVDRVKTYLELLRR